MVSTTPLIPARYLPPMGIPEFAKWMNPLWWNLFDLLLRRSVNAKKLAHSIRIAPSHTIPNIYEVAKY
jgi:hypothetical protein